jgi:hypothetical protein
LKDPSARGSRPRFAATTTCSARYGASSSLPSAYRNASRAASSSLPGSGTPARAPNILRGWHRSVDRRAAGHGLIRSTDARAARPNQDRSSQQTLPSGRFIEDEEEHTPLSASLARLRETRRGTPLAGTDAGLGWFISSNEKDELSVSPVSAEAAIRSLAFRHEDGAARSSSRIFFGSRSMRARWNWAWN